MYYIATGNKMIKRTKRVESLFSGVLNFGGKANTDTHLGQVSLGV